jgi:hypothetical protein
VAEFFAACDNAHRAHGFKGPIGHCPALTAEGIHREAVRALLSAAEPLFGIEPDELYGDNRKRYVDLLLGACLKARGRGYFQEAKAVFA